MYRTGSYPNILEIFALGTKTNFQKDNYVGKHICFLGEHKINLMLYRVLFDLIVSKETQSIWRKAS